MVAHLPVTTSNESTPVTVVAHQLATAAGLRATPVIVPDAPVALTVSDDAPDEDRAVILLAPAAPPAQAGVLAHEIAHLVLGDPSLIENRVLRAATGAVRTALQVLAVVAACAAIVWTWPAALAPAGVVGVALAGDWFVHAADRRSEELSADLLGAMLLERIGLDGLTCSLAALAAAPVEPPFMRTVGWIATTHPPIHRRWAALTTTLFPR